MQRLTEVGVLSLGKVMGAVGVGLGLIFGALYGVVFAVMGFVGMSDGKDEALGMILAGGAFCIGGPILYGIMSFLFGLLYAVILNFVFKYTGGLEIRIES